MSTSNADLVREALEIYNREGFDALTPFTSPGIEVHAAPGLLNSGDFQGIDEATRFNAEWEEAWGDLSYEPVELSELDDRHVLAVVAGTLRGERSGVEISSEQYWLFAIEDGRFTRWDLCLDRESAIAAAGDGGG
jgi:ketosteroid isomerase-like protein